MNDRLNIIEGQSRTFASAIAQDLVLLELELEDRSEPLDKAGGPPARRARRGYCGKRKAA